VKIEARFKKAISGLSPWMPLFAFIGLFQFMRGAIFDAIYFFSVVLILLLDWKGWFPFEIPKRPALSRLPVLAALTGFGVLLYLLPRRGPVEVALMIAMFLVALALSWHRDSGPIPSAPPQLLLSKWLWLTLAILISLWELFAYILSDVAGSIYAYPTISVVMDPFLKSDAGRASFLAAWLLAGFALLRIPRRK
jgi:hypothetical protein